MPPESGAASGRAGEQSAPTNPTESRPSQHLSALDIIEALPFYVMLVDERHHIVDANSAVAAELGLDRSGIIGEYCPKVIHGSDEPWHGCPLEEAVRTGRAVEREAFDERSGCWIRSGVYPLAAWSADGSRIYFHTVSDISDRKRAEKDLVASRERLRQLSRYLESACEAERTKLARQIHDGLAQSLTALKFDVTWLRKHADEDPGALIERTVSMCRVIDEAIETVQQLSAELRPSVLDDLGLVEAIQWQAQEFGRRTGIETTFKTSPSVISLDPERSTTLFRICQEALTNVARHSRATKVKLNLRKSTGYVELMVWDNGIGLDESRVAPGRAFGLMGMRERAAAWDGEVIIEGAAGKGTRVLTTLPLAKAGP